MLQRRKLLAGVGIATVGGLAGCSSSDQDGSSSSSESPDESVDGDNNEAKGESAGSDESENEFATEGDDSSLIETPEKELPLLSVSDIPEGDWQTDTISNRVTFRSETQYGSEIIEVTPDYSSSISQAKSGYSTTINSILSEGFNHLRSLQIAVESDVLQLDQQDEKQTWVLFRDANIIGFVMWGYFAEGEGFEDSNLSPPPWKNVAELAVTMHNKWR